jgi:hypothetical protein
MSNGNTSVSHVIALSGSAPDHRRTTSDTHVVAASVASPVDAGGSAEAPSVVISASAIDIHVGDTLLGTIIGPDARGQRHFVAAQGVFSVDPQSALEGLTDATLVITRTGRAIEALVQAPPQDAVQAQKLVRLQLIESTLAPLPDIFDARDMVAADNPVSVAENIAVLLRQIRQHLPQGFVLTPAIVAAPAPVPLISSAVAAVPLATDEAPVVSAAIAAATHFVDEVNNLALPPLARTPDAPAAKTIAVLPPGLTLQLAPLETGAADPPPLRLSLLAEMPDSPAARAAIAQSPLFSALVKSGRLMLVVTPPNATAPAQLIPATLQPLEKPQERVIGSAAVVLSSENAPDQPLNLPPGRLLILIDTAAAKPAHSVALMDTAMTAEDLEVIAHLQIWTQNGLAAADAATPKPLPQLKDTLPAEFILLFHAVGRKLPSPVLSRLAHTRYASSEPSPEEPQILEALRTLSRSPAASGAGSADAPQRLVLPLQVDGQILPLMLVFTPPEHLQRDGTDHAAASPDDLTQDFALVIDFDHMGPLRLHGRCTPRQLDLSVETRAPLARPVQDGAKTLFFEAMEAANLSGQINFTVASVQGWQSHPSTL